MKGIHKDSKRPKKDGGSGMTRVTVQLSNAPPPRPTPEKKKVERNEYKNYTQ